MNTYRCTISSLILNVEYILEPPQPPNALETAMVASRSINVKWQHKSQDTSEVTKYILQYKEGEGKLIKRLLAKSLFYKITIH